MLLLVLQGDRQDLSVRQRVLQRLEVGGVMVLDSLVDLLAKCRVVVQRRFDPGDRLLGMVRRLLRIHVEVGSGNVDDPPDGQS